MTNDIKIFNNPEFGEIRTVVIDDEPWFVGRDIALKLGYAKPQNALKDNVDEGDARKQGILDSNNHTQQMVIVNEAGLYSLIFGSKLESAKKFKKWVTSEVLPSIRKHGTYQLPQSTDGKIALLAQGHVELKEEINGIREDIEELKMDLPLFPVEADRITEAVRRKGVSVLGGKKSQAYSNRGLRQRVYNNLYANLKYNFGIRSYKSLKRNQVDKAIEIIQRYEPPFFLSEQIDSENSQCMIGSHDGVA